MAKSFKATAEKEKRIGFRATMPKTAALNPLFFAIISDEAKAVMIRKLLPNKPA
jgi:hypothetical protein